MKIYSAAQIKKWDAFTMEKEPVISIDLMKRSASACYDWISQNNFANNHFKIFCGKGNNGGDGLALAILLIKSNYKVNVYILESDKPGSADFETYLEKLYLTSPVIHQINSPGHFPAIGSNDIIIDAIYGTGLNKPPKDLSASLINYINHAATTTIAIDLPSGLFADSSSRGNTIINATHTLSFQNYKLAFLVPENEMYCGDVHLLNIGLHPAFENEETAEFELTDKVIINHIFKPRSKFAHKGKYGHAALVCGSSGMMGAAVLSSLACLKSGTGKLTSYIPKSGYDILQSTVPESMCFITGKDYLLSTPGLEKFNAVGIGPGIGIYPSHKKLLPEIFEQVNTPMVIDADALNLMAKKIGLLNQLPAHSILTPHPKEFEALFGHSENDFERLLLAKQKSKAYNIYIILKGHFSFISTPEGTCYFNSTGNPGMATAGSGDVLTGIITGLLAQGYKPNEAAILGAYLHGLAGDQAAGKYSEEAMIAGDIAACLGDAFKLIRSY